MRFRAFEYVRIVNQIEIAMAEAILHVLQAGTLVGMRLERLAEESSSSRRRSSASPVRVFPKVPFDAQEITEVQVLGQGPPLLADLTLADHHLELATLIVAPRRRPIPQIDEMELSGITA